MKPILYESTRTQFNDNGIGILSDAVSCFVTEERNGRFELVLNYPVDGIHYKEIKQRSIIAAKAHADGNVQPFRVYRITKPLNGMVSIYAEHISYDLSGVAVSPFTAGSAAAALQGIKTNSVIENPFEFWTDKSTVAQMNIKTPVSARAVLGGVAGSVLDTYGGEYEWDGYTVKLHNERGQNRGVSIRYGKNLVDLEQEENCAAVYTAVMPFWADSEGNTTMLTDKIVRVSGTFDFERVLTLDLSNEFDAQPTQEELQSRAQKYIADNNIGVPKVSLVVSFVPLEQTEEYKDKAFLEKVLLCDTVNVVFEKLGVSATAQVVKTVYNVLLNRYESIELGDARSNIADTIVKQEQAIKEAPKKAMSIVTQAAENATQLITGNRGGYVVIHSSTGAKEPDEILIMDKPTIEEAVKVWRWNNSGLGYSETGYSGTYTTAWTIDGAFNADFITAGTISANLIKSGLLQSLNGITTMDLDSGEITINQDDGEKIKISKKGMEFEDAEGNGKGHISFPGKRSQLLLDLGEFNERVTAPSYCYNFDENTIHEILNSNSLQLHGGNIYTPLARILADETKGGQIELRNAEENVIAEIANNSSNLGGYFRANNAEQEERATLWVTSNDSGILSLKNTNNKDIAVLSNKTGAGGQLELRNESGKATFSFSNASGGGAECWIGQGNGVSKLFDCYNGKKRLFVDELSVYGKANLISGGGLPVNECSAYIVIGQPTYSEKIINYSTAIIPANMATSRRWQIADENNYIVFTMSSSGAASKIPYNTDGSGSSSGSGGIIGVYSIR